MAARCWSRPTASTRKIETAPRSAFPEPGEVYARGDFVYWGFGDARLERLARFAGFSRAESLINVEVDGHPRIIGQLIA
jgi:hypothetical protein